ncbi:AMP-binding protein [Mesorhizobium sp. M0904]|uniref:AMP-binding protein n=1 Tax=Mesorhizobium sp. M0904 TaxID=2957022 RepID=UPI00333DF9AF
MVPSFVEALASGGNAPALLFPCRPVITYGELARRVGEQAELFGSEKRLIAIETYLSEHAIIAYLAALKRGHAVALLPPGDVAAASRFEEQYHPDIGFRRIGERWRTDHSGIPSADRLHPDLAVLLSTSGSTGLGKFVRLSEKNISANAEAIVQYLGLTISDRGALILPLHYSYGLSVLNSHLAARASLFVSGKSILEPGFIEGLRQNRCTNLAGVPYSFELLEQIGFRDESLPDLRMMTVAGGKLSPNLVRLCHSHLSKDDKELFVMYGQTEATARIAFVPPELVGENPDSIGVAIPDGELSLVDENGRTIGAADTVGELVYSGPNVTMGYASSRADLGRGAELTILKTGDLAVRKNCGLYRIVGRRSRLSKIAGLRIGHDALEHALSVRGINAAVSGDDKSIHAVYTSGHSEDAVRQALLDASGLTALHIRAQSVEALPRLASGKIDYEPLRTSLGQQQVRHVKSVHDAFREAFFPHRVCDDDSFVSLGGGSLRYVQLSLSLERILGYLPEDWEREPIAKLAVMRREKTETQSLGTDLIIRVSAILLVVIQHAALWPVPGGAAAMVMLIGYSLARFQSGNLLAGHHASVFRPLAAVLAPYYLIVAGYTIAWGEVPWASVFLVGNFGTADPADHTMLPFLYWFVEAYVQMTLIWAGLFAIPAVRRFARQDPFWFGVAFLVAALALRFIGPLAWPTGDRQIFTVPWVLYLSAFGWSLFFADNLSKKLLLLGAGAAIFPLVAYFGGNWIGSWIKYLLQFACLAALLFAPRIELPRKIVAWVLPISAASYHIYLFHRFVPELILLPMDGNLPAALLTTTAIIGGITIGLLVHEILKIALQWLATAKPIS